MAGKFCIYSIDATDTHDPSTATTSVYLDSDPIQGKYDPYGSAPDRGSVFQTLGGIFIQDFGVVDQDRRILLEDRDKLSSDTIDALKTLYAAIDTEYFFTDGYDYHKVKFSRSPKGLKYWRNLAAAHFGYHLFSYEIVLILIEESI